MIRNSFYYRNNYRLKSMVAGLIIIIILAAVVIMFFPHFLRNTYKVTVTNKQIVKRNNIDRYLIYTQTESGNIKVFEDVNDSIELKFNSGDLYWAMAINRTYEIKTYGFSIPLLSCYQNIIKVKAYGSNISPVPGIPN